MEIWTSGYLNFNADSGNYFAELNSDQQTAIYQVCAAPRGVCCPTYSMTGHTHYSWNRLLLVDGTSRPQLRDSARHDGAVDRGARPMADAYVPPRVDETFLTPALSSAKRFVHERH